MLNKRYILLKFIVATILVVGSVVYIISSSPSYKNKEFKEETATSDIKINYPFFNNGKIDSDIKSLVDQSIEEIKKVPPPPPDFPTHYKNALNFSYEKAFMSDKIVSFVFYVLTYTGGAHPNTFVKTKNYNLKTGELIKLSDVCSTDSKSILLIKSIIIRKLTDEFKKTGFVDEKWIKDGVLQSNLDNFTFEPNAAIFYFGQYEVAPYSYGIQKVKINLRGIK